MHIHTRRSRAGSILPQTSLKRGSSSNGQYGGSGGGGGTGALSKSANGIARPFHDFDSSSEEDGELVGTKTADRELYRKPYTDAE